MNLAAEGRDPGALDFPEPSFAGLVGVVDGKVQAAGVDFIKQGHRVVVVRVNDKNFLEHHLGLVPLAAVDQDLGFAEEIADSAARIEELVGFGRVQRWRVINEVLSLVEGALRFGQHAGGGAAVWIGFESSPGVLGSLAEVFLGHCLFGETIVGAVDTDNCILAIILGGPGGRQRGESRLVFFCSSAVVPMGVKIVGFLDHFPGVQLGFLAPDNLFAGGFQHLVAVHISNRYGGVTGWWGSRYGRCGGLRRREDWGWHGGGGRFGLLVILHFLGCRGARGSKVGVDGEHEFVVGAPNIGNTQQAANGEH